MKSGVLCRDRRRHVEDPRFHAWKLLRFTTPPAIAAVRELIGDRPFRQILLTSRTGPQSGELVRAYAAKHGVELLHWPQVLCDMAAQVTPSKSARNATDHVMRVLTVYGLLEDPT